MACHDAIYYVHSNGRFKVGLGIVTWFDEALRDDLWSDKAESLGLVNSPVWQTCCISNVFLVIQSIRNGLVYHFTSY